MDLIDLKAVLEITGLSRSTLNHHRFDQTAKSPFPAPCITAGQSPLWRRSDVIKWLESRDSRRGKRTAC